MLPSVALLTLVTGGTKSVSVCGVNSAAAARPSAGAGKTTLLVYLTGLYLGALILTGSVALIGSAIWEVVAVDPAVRRLAAAVVLTLIGATELALGPSALPHIRWAVPKAWAAALKPAPFLALFGFVRGLAIANHSPFASMHGWLLMVFVLPELFVPVAAAGVLATGLALWTLLYIGTWWIRAGERERLFDRVTASALAVPTRVARLDAVCLLAAAALLLTGS